MSLLSHNLEACSVTLKGKLRRPYNVSFICQSGFCYWDKYSVTYVGDEVRGACRSCGCSIPYCRQIAIL